MHGLEPFYGVRAKFLHGAQYLGERFTAIEIARFAVELVGVTDKLFLDGLRAHVAMREREVLAHDVVDSKAGPRMTLAHQRMAMKSQTVEQFTAYHAVTDVGLRTLAEYAGSMSPEYADVMKHGGFINEFPVYIKVMTVSAFQRKFSHKFAMCM